MWFLFDPTSLARLLRDADETRSRVTIDLVCGGLWASREDEGDVRITCVHGVAWITQEGQHDDILLHAGDTWHAKRRGKIVVQALEDSAIIVSAADSFAPSRKLS